MYRYRLKKKKQADEHYVNARLVCEMFHDDFRHDPSMRL